MTPLTIRVRSAQLIKVPYFVMSELPSMTPPAAINTAGSARSVIKINEAARRPVIRRADHSEGRDA